MRRHLLTVAAAFVLAAPAAAGEERPTLADLEGELICPTCQTTLDQSDAPVADRMRAFIRARIAAGDSEAEIKDALVEEFGPAVLAAPPAEGFNLLAWLLPIGGVLVGAAIVGLLAWRWTRTRESRRPPPLDPELERRLDAELARFE